MYCPVCGAQVSDSESFCMTCGSCLLPEAGLQNVGNGRLTTTERQVPAQQAPKWQPSPYPAQQNPMQQPLPMTVPQSGMPVAPSSASGGLSLPDLPYNVIGLICALLILLVNAVNRVFSFFMYSGHYSTPIEYLLSTIGFTVVMYWIGVIFLGVGSILKNRITIGIGAAFIAIEGIWVFIERITNFASGLTYSPITLILSLLGLAFYIAAAVLLIAIVIVARNKEVSPALQLTPAVLAVGTAIMYAAASLAIGNVSVFVLASFICNLALAVLFLSCAVSAANRSAASSQR